MEQPRNSDEMEIVEQNLDDEAPEGDVEVDPEREVKNPEKVMRNPLVLERIAKRLPSKTILALRGTCPLWNGNFLPELKKNHESVELSTVPDPNHPRSIERFSQLMRESNGIPFNRFKFDGIFWYDDEELVRTPKRIFNFVSDSGNFITSLDLTWSSRTILTIPELWKIVFEMTPNLVELKLRPEPEDLEEDSNEQERNRINGSTTGDVKILPKLNRLVTNSESAFVDGMSPAFMALVAAILQSAPNLEALTLNDNDHSDGLYIPSSLAALQSSTAKNNLKTLKIDTLHLVNLKALLQMGKLKDNPLRLQKFSGSVYVLIDPNYYPTDEFREMVQLLHEFLTTQSPTLKSLKLELDDDEVDSEDWSWRQRRDVPDFRIPRLKTLITLKLNTSRLSTIKILYNGSDTDTEDVTNIAGTFAKLGGISYHGDLGEHLLQVSHSDIKSLSVDGVTRSYYPDIFCTLSSRFPAVTRLQLDRTSYWVPGTPGSNMSAHQVTSLWEAWPALTHLSAHVVYPELPGDLSPDEFFSGVPRSDLQDLQRELDSLPGPVTRGALCILLCKYKSRPSLMNLRQLKQLKLNFYEPPETEEPSTTTLTTAPKRLTDLGGYFGLGLVSSSLQLLEITGYPKNSLSEECLAFIRSGLGVYALIDI